MNNNFTKLTVVLLIVAGGISTASAQFFKKIGTNPFTLNSSAALEIESTTKGFLPPRMDTAARGNLVAPAKGLVIYNTTTNSMEVNLGTPTSPSWKSTLAVNPAIKTSLTNYKMTADDYTVLMDVSDPFYLSNGEGSYLTLPPQPASGASPALPAPPVGKIYIVGKIDDTAAKLNFIPALRFSKSVTVGSLNYPALFRIQYNGTEWYIID